MDHDSRNPKRQSGRHRTVQKCSARDCFHRRARIGRIGDRETLPEQQEFGTPKYWGGRGRAVLSRLLRLARGGAPITTKGRACVDWIAMNQWLFAVRTGTLERIKLSL